jgi:hypothetical protein
MVAHIPPTTGFIPITEVLAEPKLVPLDLDTVLMAREIGVCLGD